MSRGDVQSILMTADAVGGVWTFALDLTRALAARNLRVSVAVMGPPPSAAQRAQLVAAGAVGVHEHTGRLEWMDAPWRDVEAAGRWLLQLERDVRPDVVHLNGYCHASLPWRSPVIVTAHSCVLSWWRGVYQAPAPDSWARYASEVTRGLAAAGLVTAPTAAMGASLEAHYGTLRRVRIIPNGRRPIVPSPAVPKEPFVLSAGRLWDPAKNIEAVCAVAPGLAWPVYVAGDQRSPDGDLVACEGVSCLGRLSEGELAGWMARGSIFVSPARYEPFGLSILEAALAGCALVLGDIPTLREIWGDAAIFVAPGDRAALHAALAALVRDESLRARMAQKARTHARDYTPARMADGYCDAYRELAGELRPLLSLSAV